MLVDERGFEPPAELTVCAGTDSRRPATARLKAKSDEPKGIEHTALQRLWRPAPSASMSRSISYKRVLEHVTNVQP